MNVFIFVTVFLSAFQIAVSLPIERSDDNIHARRFEDSWVPRYRIKRTLKNLSSNSYRNPFPLDVEKLDKSISNCSNVLIKNEVNYKSLIHLIYLLYEQTNHGLINWLLDIIKNFSPVTSKYNIGTDENPIIVKRIIQDNISYLLYYNRKGLIWGIPILNLSEKNGTENKEVTKEIASVNYQLEGNIYYQIEYDKDGNIVRKKPLATFSTLPPVVNNRNKSKNTNQKDNNTREMILTTPPVETSGLSYQYEFFGNILYFVTYNKGGKIVSRKPMETLMQKANQTEDVVYENNILYAITYDNDENIINKKIIKPPIKLIDMKTQPILVYYTTEDDILYATTYDSKGNMINKKKVDALPTVGTNKPIVTEAINKTIVKYVVENNILYAITYNSDGGIISKNIVERLSTTMEPIIQPEMIQYELKDNILYLITYDENGDVINKKVVEVLPTATEAENRSSVVKYEIEDNILYAITYNSDGGIISKKVVEILSTTTEPVIQPEMIQYEIKENILYLITYDENGEVINKKIVEVLSTTTEAINKNSVVKYKVI